LENVFNLKLQSKKQNDVLPVGPDWAIYWILGNFLKLLATINFAQISRILMQF